MSTRQRHNAIVFFKCLFVSAFTKGDLKLFTKAIESGAMVSLKKFETDGYFGSPALIEDDIDDLRHVCRQRGIKYRPSHCIPLVS